MDVGEDHPAPDSEEKAQPGPAAAELRPEQREPVQRPKRTLDTVPRIRREAVRPHEAREVFDGSLV